MANEPSNMAASGSEPTVLAHEVIEVTSDGWGPVDNGIDNTASNWGPVGNGIDNTASNWGPVEGINSVANDWAPMTTTERGIDLTTEYRNVDAKYAGISQTVTDRASELVRRGLLSDETQVRNANANDMQVNRAVYYLSQD
jgi:hypothetical protein